MRHAVITESHALIKPKFAAIDAAGRMALQLIFSASALIMRPVAHTYSHPSIYSRAQLPRCLAMDEDYWSGKNVATELDYSRFPTAETAPAEVLERQLDALRHGDLDSIFQLFSRARRFELEESARRDLRERNPPRERVFLALAELLANSCPGLISHSSATVVACLGDPCPKRGLLPQWSARVRVETATGVQRTYTFTLTRQSDYDGGDRRDYDGYEGCWFVWTIKYDDSDGGSAVDGVSAPPSSLRS